MNDQKYCADCKKVVLEALMDVPVRYRCVTIPQDGVTLEMLKEWEADRYREHQDKMEKAAAEGRVMFPLIREVLPQGVMVVKGRGPHQHKTFFAQDDKVLVFAEQNTDTGETTLSERF